MEHTLIPVSLDDTSSKYVYIDSTIAGNNWVVASPQKPFFNAAYSAPFALLTDSVNSYSSNQFSVFNMKIIRCYGNSDVTWLTFRHKYQTDSLSDGGNIEVSFDNGVTYGNLIDTSFLSNYNISSYAGIPPDLYTMNDTVAALGNKPRFSGNSGGWIYSSFYLFTMYSSVDTILLRFVFASDSVQTNKEGWMIDDINPGAYIVSVPELTENKTVIYPNPADGILNLKCRPNEEFSISVFNASGELISTRIGMEGTGIYSMDVNRLQPGMYYLKGFSRTGAFTHRLIIAR